MTWNFDRCSYKDTKDFSLHACTKFNLKKNAYLFKKEVMLDCYKESSKYCDHKIIFVLCVNFW